TPPRTRLLPRLLQYPIRRLPAERLQHLQWQTLSGLAVGRGGEATVGMVLHRVTAFVAHHNLPGKLLKRLDRRELALTPLMSLLPADRISPLGIQHLDQIDRVCILEPCGTCHPCPPVCWCF